MNDYRYLSSGGKLEWRLPDNYYLGSVQIHRHKSLPAFHVYVYYMATEEGLGYFDVSAVGDGPSFELALASTLEKCQAKLAEARRDRQAWIDNPNKPVPRLKPDDKPVNISGIDTSTLSFDL